MFAERTALQLCYTISQSACAYVDLSLEPSQLPICIASGQLRTSLLPEVAVGAVNGL